MKIEPLNCTMGEALAAHARTRNKKHGKSVAVIDGALYITIITADGKRKRVLRTPLSKWAFEYNALKEDGSVPPTLIEDTMPLQWSAHADHTTIAHGLNAGQHGFRTYREGLHDSGPHPYIEKKKTEYVLSKPGPNTWFRPGTPKLRWHRRAQAPKFGDMADPTKCTMLYPSYCGTLYADITKILAGDDAEMVNLYGTDVPMDVEYILSACVAKTVDGEDCVRVATAVWTVGGPAPVDQHNQYIKFDDYLMDGTGIGTQYIYESFVLGEAYEIQGTPGLGEAAWHVPPEVRGQTAYVRIALWYDRIPADWNSDGSKFIVPGSNTSPPDVSKYPIAVIFNVSKANKHETEKTVTRELYIPNLPFAGGGSESTTTITHPVEDLTAGVPEVIQLKKGQWRHNTGVEAPYGSMFRDPPWNTGAMITNPNGDFVPLTYRIEGTATTDKTVVHKVDNISELGFAAIGFAFLSVYTDPPNQEWPCSVVTHHEATATYDETDEQTSIAKWSWSNPTEKMYYWEGVVGSWGEMYTEVYMNKVYTVKAIDSNIQRTQNNITDALYACVGTGGVRMAAYGASYNYLVKRDRIYNTTDDEPYSRRFTDMLPADTWVSPTPGAVNTGPSYAQYWDTGTTAYERTMDELDEVPPYSKGQIALAVADIYDDLGMCTYKGTIPCGGNSTHTFGSTNDPYADIISTTVTNPATTASSSAVFKTYRNLIEIATSGTLTFKNRENFIGPMVYPGAAAWCRATHSVLAVLNDDKVVGVLQKGKKFVELVDNNAEPSPVNWALSTNYEANPVAQVYSL